MRGQLTITACMVLLCCALSPLAAAAATGDRIYGEELMTLQERDAYRQQLWERKTERERESFRDRHRRMIQERARDLALPLPDDGLSRLGPRSESPAARRSGDGLRRLADNPPERAPLRRWERAPAPASALRQWPERTPEHDGREVKPAGSYGSGKESAEARD